MHHQHHYTTTNNKNNNNNNMEIQEDMSFEIGRSCKILVLVDIYSVSSLDNRDRWCRVRNCWITDWIVLPHIAYGLKSRPTKETRHNIRRLRWKKRSSIYYKITLDATHTVLSVYSSKATKKQYNALFDQRQRGCLSKWTCKYQTTFLYV